MKQSDGLSPTWTVNLDSSQVQRGGHPSAQNYCAPAAAADRSCAGDLGNVSVAARPCDDRQTLLACRGVRTYLVVVRNYADRRSDRVEYAALVVVGTSFQTAAVRTDLHDLCWRENNPTYS